MTTGGPKSPVLTKLPTANPAYSTIHHKHHEDERHNNDRIVVFTDGSSINIEHRTLQRAGWAAFYGKHHPWNAPG